MSKIAIFIDAFITDQARHDVFLKNIDKFSESGFDLFVISNKIPRFDKFSKVKYFEYDSTNRILADKNRYILSTYMSWWSDLSPGIIRGLTKVHGFTNWTFLYNLKKMAGILKSRGYTHMIRCDYDIVFTDYNLMNTIFKDFKVTDKCLVLSDEYGCVANFFLIDIDFTLNIIPDMETEDDYEKFMCNIYGSNTSPVFETLFHDLIKKECTYLDKTNTDKYVGDLKLFTSGGDLGYRHDVVYGDMLMTPVNDNKQFIVINQGLKCIYVDYTTEGYSEIVCVDPGRWIMFYICTNYIDVRTSQMPTNKVCHFDLSKPCQFKYSDN